MSKIQNDTIEITAAGNVLDSETAIISIQAIASADASACVITDNDGVVIAQFESSISNHRTYDPVYLGGKVVKGIDVGIWTNMKKVIIHIGK